MPGQQQLSSKRTHKWSTDAVEIAWYCAIYLKVFKCPNADKAVTHRINPATSSPGDRVSRHCLAAAPAHVRIDTAGKLATCPLSGFAKASKKSARWRMAWKSLALRGGGGAIAASSISTTPAAPRYLRDRTTSSKQHTEAQNDSQEINASQAVLTPPASSATCSGFLPALFRIDISAIIVAIPRREPSRNNSPGISLGKRNTLGHVRHAL